MAIRVTVVREDGKSAVRVDGRLVAADIDVLLQAVSEADESALLDLTHLHGTDDEGLKAILRLVDRGHLIVAASPYIKLRLNRGSNAPAVSTTSKPV